MASATVDVATGSTVTFATSGYTAEALSIGITGSTRPAVKTTHLATTQATGTQFGGDTFIPGSFADPGQLDLEMHFDPDKISLDPMLNAASELITVQITDATVKASWTMNGFCISHDINMSGDEEPMSLSMSFKLTGVVTAVVSA